MKADAVPAVPSTPPIAVLDSGVADVPELSNRLRTGYDATTGGQNTNDTDGHGTAVASVAAASAGGVRGISPSSPIIPIKIFDARGESRAEWVIAGIKRAIALHAGVINLSAAGPSDNVDPVADRGVQDAVFQAVTRGIPVIAPTGNEGAGKLDIPAVYPHVIAVAGTDEGGSRAEYSNAGPGTDLAAPGDMLTTAAPSFLCASGYSLSTGTSFAAPIVSAATALLLQEHPQLDVGQVTDMLRLRGLQRASWTPSLGFGLLDIPSALAAPVPAADAPEVNDTVAWAKLHAPVLTTTRSNVTIKARIETQQDPADVYRVRLKKHDVVQIGKARVAGGSARLTVALMNARRRLAGPGKYRIRRAGTYYVRVVASRTPPAGSDYSLSLSRGR